MFTGLIEEVGTIKRLEKKGQRHDLVVEAHEVTRDLRIDHSISVNGICLTVVEHSPTAFRVQVIPQTIRMSALHAYQTGDAVNLERALAAGDRLGGHFVQGHVDGVGTVAGWQHGDDDVRLRVNVDEDLLRFCVDQGSISIDGVSLTIASMDTQTVEVALIPHTLKMTTLGNRTIGDPVNVEVDMLSKYVHRHLHPEESTGMTIEWLKEQGM